MTLRIKLNIQLLLVMIFVGLFSLQETSAAELELIQLEQLKQGDTTGNHYQYLIDSNHLLSIDDVIQSSDWLDPEPGVVNRGFSTALNWMKFNLNNSASRSQQLIIEYVDAAAQNIQLYYRPLNSTESFTLVEFVFNQPVDSREISFYRPAFPVHIDADQSLEIYIRIFQGDQFPMHSFTSFRIWNEKAFYRSSQIEMSLLVLLLCTELFMGIATLIVFLTSREKVFFYYSLFAFSMASLFASFSGLWSYFISTDGYELWMVVFQISIAQIASILFVRSFFNTKQLSKLVDRTLQILLGILIVGCILNLLGYPYYSRIIIDHMAFAYVLLIGLGFYAWKKKLPHALLFTVSWLVFIIGMAFASLRLRGYINDSFWAEWLIYFGGFIEAFLLSTIMVLRLNDLRNEKNQLLVKQQEDRFIFQKHQAEIERKTAEELRELNRLKDQFLANTSHELRTPLNGIIGLSELLQDEPDSDLSEDSLQSIQAINQCGKQLKFLVDELLDYSQLLHKKVKLNFQIFDLNLTCSEVIRLLNPMAEIKGLTLEFNPNDGECPVNADENRIRQVLYNLITNAIKYSEKGKVSVNLTLKNNRYEIQVADQGIGIAHEQLEKIFLSFTQSDGSSSRSQGGVGLGLAICKDLIELHQSKLSVISQLGKGSEFSFFLPADKNR